MFTPIQLTAEKSLSPFPSVQAFAPQPLRFPRTVRSRPIVLAGRDLLSQGSELARYLWNRARAWQRQYYCQTGAYANWTELQRALRRQGGTFGLNDRCFSYTLRRYNANLQVWRHQRLNRPDLRPPGYAYRPQPLLFEVGRNAVPIAPWTYRLTVLSSNSTTRHTLIKLQLRPGIKMAQVKTIQIQPDLSAILTYYLDLIPPLPGPGLAGIDLGIANLAAVAFESGESILYSGQVLQDLEQRTRQRDSQADWAKVRHIRRLALHQLTNSIIRECQIRQVGIIVIGNLKHIRQNKRQRAVRMWAFGRITEQLHYKAAEAGIQVIPVDERYTSQRCHRCGQLGQRKGRHFVCETCSCWMNADVNAAFNLLNKLALPPASAAVELSSDSGRAKNLTQIRPTYRANFSRSYNIHLYPPEKNID